MTRFLGPEHFVDFLGGQTKPARFRIGDRLWVVRYPGDPQRNLRLASEFVAYRLATLLKLSVPEFELFMIRECFTPKGSNLTLGEGSATGCSWIDDAVFPDLEHEPLDPFWSTEPYVILTATLRLADTWMMNYDRRKAGNVAVRCSPFQPEVFFLDFDQSFLAKQVKGGHRPHWICTDFEPRFLDDHELLSGFDGTGCTKNAFLQKEVHFRPALERLIAIQERQLVEITSEIPVEWGVSEAARKVWVDYLLRRRAIMEEIIPRA